MSRTDNSKKKTKMTKNHIENLYNLPNNHVLIKI